MRKFLMVSTMLMMLCGTAHAQWAVLDFANLLQSIQQVMSNWEQEYYQAQSYLTQTQQLEAQYTQLKNLDAGSVSGAFGTVGSALSTQKRYTNSVSNLYGGLGNAKSVIENLYARMGASGLSPSEWMKRAAEENQRTHQGNGYLNDYQADVLQQVGRRYEAVRGLQDDIVSTEGTHQDLQLLNSQTNVLVGTMNQLVEQNAAMAQHSVSNAAENTAREKATLDNYAAWLESRKASRQTSDDLLKKLGATAR